MSRESFCEMEACRNAEKTAVEKWEIGTVKGMEPHLWNGGCDFPAELVRLVYEHVCADCYEFGVRPLLVCQRWLC